MIFLEIESPSPVPTPTAFVVKPPAKIFGPSSGRMPRPVSEMEMWTQSPKLANLNDAKGTCEGESNMRKGSTVIYVDIYDKEN